MTGGSLFREFREGADNREVREFKEFRESADNAFLKLFKLPNFLNDSAYLNNCTTCASYPRMIY